MKLAAQLFTIRDFTQTPEDIKKSLKKIKDIGYEAVQVSGFGKINPELLKEYLEENGLELCATHTAFDRIINDTDSVIYEHKIWNCPYVGLGSMLPEYRENRESCDEFLKLLAPATKKIHDAGLKFLYHNHRFEFEKISNDSTIIDYIADNTKPEEFGFLADFYWVQAGGASPVAYIEKYAERLDVVHFKDMKIVNDTMDMAEIFEGNMDYLGIYNACLKNGVKWAAIEQDDCPADPFDSLEISFKNLKSKGLF
ncbi:MAG: sugar phosphate isomerase/epimerase [Oscillospiraceae bacterium]